MAEGPRRSGAMQSAAPIVPNARVVMRCACGYSTDSAEKTIARGIDEARKKHRCPAPSFTGEVTDYTAHPLFAGRFRHADRGGR